MSTQSRVAVRELISGYGSITAQIGLNSLIGFVFVKVLAFHYGTSADKDGFDIAYSVPFIIMAASGFSFLHSIVTTYFARLSTLGRLSDAQHSFSLFLTAMCLFGAIIIIMCVCFASSVTTLLAPGFTPDQKMRTQRLLIAMCPLVLTLGVTTYISAVLIAYLHPLTMEFAQMISRICAIGWIWVSGNYDLFSITMALVAGSSAALCVQWVVLINVTPLRYHFTLQATGHRIGTVSKQAAGFCIAAILAQASMAYMRRLATLDGPGTTAAITYAMTLAGPLTLLLGKPLALTIGPAYIRRMQAGDTRAGRWLLGSALCAGLLVSIILVLGLNHWSSWLVATLYGGGRFDRSALLVTCSLLQIMNWSLPPAVLLWIVLFPLLNAYDSSIPAAIYCIGYVAHGIFSWTLFYAHGKTGLALGFVLSVVLQCLLGIASLAWIEKKHYQHEHASGKTL